MSNETYLEDTKTIMVWHTKHKTVRDAAKMNNIPKHVYTEGSPTEYNLIYSTVINVKRPLCLGLPCYSMLSNANWEPALCSS